MTHEDSTIHPDLRRAIQCAVHDLRQPLSSALLLVSSWRRHQPDGGEAEAIVGHIELALGALSERIQDMRRIASDKPAPVSEFPPSLAAIEVADQAKPLLASAGIDLVLAIDPSPAYIRGPRVVFDRLVFNLLENAALHARHAREVRVQLEVHAERLRLSVDDDGEGWSTAGPRRTGGLGLDFCSWAVRAFGGSLHIGDGQSGGHFEAEFPRSDARAAAAYPRVST